MTGMETVDIFKALANDTRPNRFSSVAEGAGKVFPPQDSYSEGDSFDHSVCVVGDLRQSGFHSLPHYLDMQRGRGFCESRCHGKWTSYRRNEENIRKPQDYIATRI